MENGKDRTSQEQNQKWGYSESEVTISHYKCLHRGVAGSTLLLEDSFGSVCRSPIDVGIKSHVLYMTYNPCVI